MKSKVSFGIPNFESFGLVKISKAYPHNDGIGMIDSRLSWFQKLHCGHSNSRPYDIHNPQSGHQCLIQTGRPIYDFNVCYPDLDVANLCHGLNCIPVIPAKVVSHRSRFRLAKSIILEAFFRKF